MIFAIADPPYPPLLNAVGGYKPRATRWYGAEFRGNNRRSADFHESAHEWDSPARHRQLIEDLTSQYDGWAIATAPDALEVYSPLPKGARIAAWVKPNGIPGAHRLRSTWEPIILLVPPERAGNVGRGSIADVVVAQAPSNGFPGEKPPEWVRFVLRTFSFDPATDNCVDLFPGSGAVQHEIDHMQFNLFDQVEEA